MTENEKKDRVLIHVSGALYYMDPQHNTYGKTPWTNNIEKALRLTRKEAESLQANLLEYGYLTTILTIE